MKNGVVSFAGPAAVFVSSSGTPDGSESRFELKRNEAIELGDVITQGTTRYMATRVLPDESDRFDAIVEAQWFAGPVQHLGRSE